MKVDGGSLREIYEAIEQGKAQGDQPVAIILDTVKGQGVPYWKRRPITITSVPAKPMKPLF
ncbi:hypothetical protein HMSSN036_84980 [Paenibacillus macerans]|nr:hypothetical protein HMSSN036_84980 [Paenibacillus macerans]